MYFVQQKGRTSEKWKSMEGLGVAVSHQKCGKMCVEVTLPPRCIYVMHGPARLDWKHGIRMQTAARLASFPAPPSWNPWNMRRSLTFRCTKAYSDAYLQHELSLKPNDTALQARWKQQRPLRPQDDYGEGEASGEQLAKMRADAQITLQFILNSPFRDVRFGGFHGMASNGNRLGGEDAKDSGLQAAIRASLGESIQTTNAGGGSADNPISLDDDDDESGGDENTADSKIPAQPSNKREVTEEEDEESKRKRLRLARLRRFETQNRNGEQVEGVGLVPTWF